MNHIIINTKKAVSVSDERLTDKASRSGRIGLFFEDINYNLDGGLYAEMLENRSFEAVRSYGVWDDYRNEYDGLYAWRPLSRAELSIRTDRPVAEENPHYLHVGAKAPGAGFANQAYDGIYMKKDASCKVSFYAKTKEPVMARIAVHDGGLLVAQADVLIHGDEWKQYVAMVTAMETVEKGRFSITLLSPAEVDFDWISMIPEDAVLGLFRKDLFDKLAALKPGFMRFPGGCIIEGNNLANRYQWKQTIGPKEHRVYNWNRWAVHGVLPKGTPGWEVDFESPYSHYGQTYGVGYYEYFLLCEALGAKPLPVLSVGLACQYQSTELVPMDAPEFQEYIQDALDLIEFANGDPTTPWGAKRAEMGHPEPFHMDLLGIGNEQWQTDFQDFYERYEAFEKAIHAVYPDMRLIGSAGPDVLTPRHEDAWKWLHKRADERVKETGIQDFTYAVDEHYYVRPKWLYEHVHFYDDYPRRVKVFAGEYAAHIEGKAGKFNSEAANSYEAALAEAAFLTGVERNADVVIMASYAPLIARIGWAQWSPDLIWFDGDASYGTPSYYVQQLYSLYTGTESYEVKVEGEEDIYASATDLAIKLVNRSEEEKTVQMEGIRLPETVHSLVMSYDLNARNSIDAPEAVVPIEEEMTVKDGVITLKPHSFTVICLQ